MFYPDRTVCLFFLLISPTVEAALVCFPTTSLATSCSSTCCSNTRLQHRR